MRDANRPSSAAPGSSVALVAILLAGAALVMVLTRGLTFYYDEWSFLLDRRGLTLDTFLKPHNEHLSLVPIAVYKAMVQVFGMDHYWGFRLMIAATATAVAALVYAFSVPRIGRWAALAPTAIVALLGSGWENMLWPFQIGMLIAIGCGIAAMLALDRGTRRGDAVAAAALTLAVATSSIGLPVVAGIAVELAVRRQLRVRWWVVGLPLALYALWWIPYHVATFKSANVPKVPGFVTDMAASAIAGALGRGLEAGRILLPLAVLALGFIVLRRRELLTPRLWGILATAGAFWIATALTRADLGVPSGPRYVWVGAILMLLAAVELGRGSVRGRVPVLLLVGLTAVSLGGNLIAYKEGRRHFKFFADEVKPALAALEVARGVTPDPNLVIEPTYAPPVRSAAYLAAVDAFGSASGIDPERAAELPDGQRRKLDVSLARAVALALVPQPAPAIGGRPPLTLGADGVRVTPSGASCVRVRSTRPHGVAILHAPGAAGLALRSPKPATVAAGRFAAGVGIGLAPLAPGGWSVVNLPLGTSPTPWRVAIDPATTVRVCTTVP